MILTHVSLFSGIGGIDLSAEWAGFETILQVEIDPYCQKVLRKHWPDVRLIGDIRDVNAAVIADAYRGMHLQSSDKICSGRETLDVSLVTGGPPCQPASVAGKRRGKTDDRWLWPETIRVIRLIKPRWVCLENPAGIITLGKSGQTLDLAGGSLDILSAGYTAALDGICAEIEGCGYEVQPVVIPACAVGAPHRRDRVWIIAHDRQLQRLRCEGERIQRAEQTRREARAGDRPTCPNTNGSGLQGCGEYGERARERPVGASHWQEHWLSAVSRLCRVDDGVSRKLDRTARLKALGNAVVPQQVYPILKAIADYETSQQKPRLRR